LVFRRKQEYRKQTYDEGEDELADVVSNAWRDVGTELLEGGEKSLQLAQLTGAARRWQLLLLLR